MANVITLKLLPEQRQKLLHTFYEERTDKIPAYAEFQLRCENCVITSYASGKVVFQGSDAEVYASPFMVQDSGMFPQAGSDEVGTGDYFGPVCVCASVVRPEDAESLRRLGVRDSKALSDSEIRKTAPELMKLLVHSLLILPPARYNLVHADSNMNAIKSKLHNMAYVHLREKTELPSLVVIDQFTPEAGYYRYIASEKQIVRGIHFETKAENKYPAVGASSIIARYAFLRYWDEMEKKYGMTFVKGASAAVDQCARDFVSRYGKEKLGSVAKLHYKNTERI